ncbi:MAG: bifunctional phosphopantothenoylcysteine decarboxylase/phosphopantothenate synthase [Actinomycetaceae bacterium]|nr:bifunctional phosphopantothenoylcysteine decarboxylase/phosphopantothenate synthase [Actinomycetaceae bacterium]
MSSKTDAGRTPRRIVVGVGAGIAAYKVPAVVRHFIKSGDDVRVMPTEASLHFVGKTTWQALSNNPAHTSVFEEDAGVDHVEAARDADLIVIAPATADLIAQIRAGLAGDLLTTTVLAATCPVLIVPAMHTAMWDNPATADNIATLKQRGIHILSPAEGALSSGDTGRGRMPEPEEIARAAEDILARAMGAVTGGGDAAARTAHASSSEEPLERSGITQDLAGVKAFVTAGGTREPIDPVRFLGNHSTGMQGTAIATALKERGASVTLFAANIAKDLIPQGIEVVQTPSATDLYEAVMERAAQFQVGFFVAAVADFRPREYFESKVKKTDDNADGLTIELVRNPDILAQASRAYPELYTVGFAAETGDLETVMRFGREKARKKGAELIAINRVGDGLGFAAAQNAISVVTASGEVVLEASGTKLDVARELVALVANRIFS